VTSWRLTGPELTGTVEIMGENMRWFGRKSAPDVRPFVPAWLSAEGQPGFARSYDAQFEEVYRRNLGALRAHGLIAA
jgi:hypothetical protein